jgi:hypothetical protein
MPVAASRYIVIGNPGSDAGYWVWDGTGWKHVGGWGIDQLTEVTNGLRIMAQASRIKTPGVADQLTRSVADFVGKELDAHLGQQAGAGAQGAGTNYIIIIGG